MLTKVFKFILSSRAEADWMQSFRKFFRAQSRRNWIFSNILYYYIYNQTVTADRCRKIYGRFVDGLSQKCSSKLRL